MRAWKSRASACVTPFFPPTYTKRTSFGPNQDRSHKFHGVNVNDRFPTCVKFGCSPPLARNQISILFFHSTTGYTFYFRGNSKERYEGC